MSIDGYSAAAFTSSAAFEFFGITLASLGTALCRGETQVPVSGSSGTCGVILSAGVSAIVIAGSTATGGGIVQASSAGMVLTTSFFAGVFGSAMGASSESNKYMSLKAIVPSVAVGVVTGIGVGILSPALGIVAGTSAAWATGYGLFKCCFSGKQGESKPLLPTSELS